MILTIVLFFYFKINSLAPSVRLSEIKKFNPLESCSKGFDLKKNFEYELKIGIERSLQYFFPHLKSFSLKKFIASQNQKGDFFFNHSIVKGLEYQEGHLICFINQERLNHLCQYVPLYYQSGVSYLIFKAIEDFIKKGRHPQDILNKEGQIKLKNYLRECLESDQKEIESVEYECANNFYSSLQPELLEEYLPLIKEYFLWHSKPFDKTKNWLSIGLGLSKNPFLSDIDFTSDIQFFLKQENKLGIFDVKILENACEKYQAIQKAMQDSGESLLVYPLLLHDAIFSLLKEESQTTKQSYLRYIDQVLTKQSYSMTKAFETLTESSLTEVDYNEFDSFLISCILNQKLSLNKLERNVILKKLVQVYQEKRRFFTPDFVFRPESALVFEYRGQKYALLGNFGSEQSRKERGPEAVYNRQFYESLGYQCIDLEAPFEAGAEVKFLRKKSKEHPGRYILNVIVNYGFRNSKETFDELKGILKHLFKEEDENDLLQFYLVQTIRDDFYHLDVALAVVYSPVLEEEVLMYYPFAFSQESQRMLKNLSHKSIEVLPKDCYFFACNSPTIDHLIFIDKRISDILKSDLNSLGIKIIPINVSEFYKAGGGGKCLVCEMHLSSPFDLMTRQNVSFLVTEKFGNMFTVEYKIESLMGGLPSMKLAQQQHRKMVEIFRLNGVKVTPLQFPAELSPESDKRSLLMAFMQSDEEVQEKYRVCWDEFIRISGGFISLHQFIQKESIVPFNEGELREFYEELSTENQLFLQKTMIQFKKYYQQAYTRKGIPFSPARFRLSQSKRDEKGSLPFQMSFNEVLLFLETDRQITKESLHAHEQGEANQLSTLIQRPHLVSPPEEENILKQA